MIHEIIKVYDEPVPPPYVPPATVHYFPKVVSEHDKIRIKQAQDEIEKKKLIIGAKVRVLESGHIGKISYIITHPDGIIWEDNLPLLIRVIELPTLPTTECFHPDQLEVYEELK